MGNDNGTSAIPQNPESKKSHFSNLLAPLAKFGFLMVLIGIVIEKSYSNYDVGMLLVKIGLTLVLTRSMVQINNWFSSREK